MYTPLAAFSMAVLLLQLYALRGGAVGRRRELGSHKSALFAAA
jgi:hypothetical protein